MLFLLSRCVISVPISVDRIRETNNRQLRCSAHKRVSTKLVNVNGSHSNTEGNALACS